MSPHEPPPWVHPSDDPWGKLPLGGTPFIPPVVVKELLISLSGVFQKLIPSTIINYRQVLKHGETWETEPIEDRRSGITVIHQTI